MASTNQSLLAAIAGIISCTVFFSMNSTLNYIALPSYLLPRIHSSRSISSDEKLDRPESSTDLILRQWELTYATGHMVGPTSCVFSTLAYIFAGWTAPEGARGLYFAAAASAAVAVPFTVVFILPTNDELYRRADLLRGKTSGGPSKLDKVETLTLIRKCHFLSKVRAWMPVPPVTLALYAIART